MVILTWIVFGFIAGLLAKFIIPGNKKLSGFILTAILGIVGSAVGGFIGTELGWGKVNDFDIRSLGLAILGSVVVLLLYRAFTSKD